MMKPPPLSGVRDWGDLALGLLFVAFMFTVLTDLFTEVGLDKDSPEGGAES